MCLHGIFRNHQYCCTIGGIHKCSYYDPNNRIDGDACDSYCSCPQWEDHIVSEKLFEE